VEALPSLSVVVKVEDQNVVVRAVGDNVAESTEVHFVRHELFSSDDAYSGTKVAFWKDGGNVTVVVHDNDFAGVSISKVTAGGVSDTVAVREGGVNGSYTLELDSAPLDKVFIQAFVNEARRAGCVSDGGSVNKHQLEPAANDHVFREGRRYRRGDGIRECTTCRTRLDSVNLQFFKIAGSENNDTAGRSIMIDAMGPVRGPVFAKIPSENNQPMDIDVSSFVNDAIFTLASEVVITIDFGAPG
jgi:hypothetical protein